MRHTIPRAPERVRGPARGPGRDRAWRAALAALVALTAAAGGATNVSQSQKHAWTENAGWSNWRDASGGSAGVAVRPGSHLEGFAWFENLGWIDLGSGAAPYANTSGATFGVNLVPRAGSPNTQDMIGFAWAENAGWVVFNNWPPAVGAAPPTWDAAANRARGYAWAENIGWINLHDAVFYICSMPGDANADGVVDVSDFFLLAANFGSAVPPGTLGDVNGDGAVDVSDFFLLAANFGSNC